MKKNRLHLTIAALFGVTVAVAAQAASLDLGNIGGIFRNLATATTGIGEKEEIAIGRELAGRTLGAAPLVNDPALQAYVNKVGRWVASQSERPELPWHFGVMETPSINAFAVPGGYVLITRGLYEILENESQLAGVLGHEIGHIVQRHHITVMQKQAGTAALAGAAQEALAQRGGRSAMFNNILGTGAEVLARGLDKDAEYEADHLGVVLAARAGYSPSGLIEVLHKLQARAADASLSLLFATHPHPGERLGKLGEAMTPRMSSLPTGQEPNIQPVSADAPRATGTAQRLPAGARAMQEEKQQAYGPPGEGPIPGMPARGSGSGSGLGPSGAVPAPRGTIDPGGLFRGLMGR